MFMMDDQNIECPLCMEPLEMDDINFFPCTCGYQICRFCWHRIRTDENGLCPACRKQYPEDPADFKPLSVEELHKIKNEKRQKDLQRKQKLSENRKHLANVRVVQKNLVFVVGLPPRLADAEALRKHDCFGKYGRIHKVVVNHSTSYAGIQGPSASAYVTYYRAEDALRAIHAVNNVKVDGRTLKASLGTTKYCNYFLKSQQCPKTDCMYLHELGDEAASFTKEEMQHGKHQDYERRLHDQIVGSSSSTAAAATLGGNTTSKKSKPGGRKGNVAPRHARHIDYKAARSKADENFQQLDLQPPSAKESSPPPDNPSPTFSPLTPPSPDNNADVIDVQTNDDPPQQEDDLGFDPWDECSKGLADLLEKEAVTKVAVGPPPGLQPQQRHMVLHPPSQSFPLRPPPFVEPMIRRPPPPPGFGTHRSALPPFFAAPKPTNMAELYALQESQEALRSLLPNVNITFGPPVMSQQGLPVRGPPATPWEASSQMSWIGPDPAILSRGGLADAAANMAARF